MILQCESLSQYVYVCVDAFEIDSVDKRVNRISEFQMVVLLCLCPAPRIDAVDGAARGLLVRQRLGKERSTAVHPDVKRRFEAVPADEPGHEIGLTDTAPSAKVNGYLLQDGGKALVELVHWRCSVVHESWGRITPPQ